MLNANLISDKILVLLFVSICVDSLAIDKDNEYVDTSTGKFQMDCIKVHNYYRRFHGSPPLKHSAKLEDFARNRAVEIAKKDGTNFHHPDDLIYGENLAWNSIVNVDCKIPLKLWYDEWKIYNFNKPNITSTNGHFTQVVWKETRKVGCGQAVSKGKVGGTYTVCNYDPPGNYINEELENVKPAIKKKYRPTPKPGQKRNNRKPKKVNKNKKPKPNGTVQ